MKTSLLSRWCRIGLLLGVVCGAIACGPSIAGTYRNDTMGVVVNLRSGGQATFQSSLGDNDVCRWNSSGSQVTLDCKHDKTTFTVNGDGSLSAPFFGNLQKTK